MTSRHVPGSPSEDEGEDDVEAHRPDSLASTTQIVMLAMGGVSDTHAGLSHRQERCLNKRQSLLGHAKCCLRALHLLLSGRAAYLLFISAVAAVEVGN